MHSIVPPLPPQTQGAASQIPNRPIDVLHVVVLVFVVVFIVIIVVIVVIQGDPDSRCSRPHAEMDCAR